MKQNTCRQAEATLLVNTIKAYASNLILHFYRAAMAKDAKPPANYSTVMMPRPRRLNTNASKSTAKVG